MKQYRPGIHAPEPVGSKTGWLGAVRWSLIQTIQYDFDNYIASNDVTLKANINQLNGTMQNIYHDNLQNTYKLKKTIQKGVANPAISLW